MDIEKALKVLNGLKSLVTENIELHFRVNMGAIEVLAETATNEVLLLIKTNTFDINEVALSVNKLLGEYDVISDVHKCINHFIDKMGREPKYIMLGVYDMICLGKQGISDFDSIKTLINHDRPHYLLVGI